MAAPLNPTVPESLDASASRSSEAFAARVASGETRAGARLMRYLDDRDPRAVPILRALYAALRETPGPRRAHVIGLTGNPGAGKSTLGAALVAHWRKQGKKVGVIAIDPSSPFSGGAILGDRIRMAEHSLDDAVFIRSVATRGHLGGLSASTHDLVLVFEAMGYDPILIETVGVGQDEVDVVRVADTTAVVMVPGLGDEIQALKAGLLEVADVFVLNKADRDGVDRAERDLRTMQSLAQSHDHNAPWEVPIVRTVATERTGIAALCDVLDAHRERRGSLPGERRLARARHVLEGLVRDRIQQAFDAALTSLGAEEVLTGVADRAVDPWAQAEAILTAMWSRVAR